jgi:hypothetical protein
MNQNKIQLKGNPAPKLRTLKRKLIVWWYSNFSLKIILNRHKKLIIKYVNKITLINKLINDLELNTKKI